MYFDPTYFIFVIPPLLLGLWAQMKVKGAYAKWTQVRNQRGPTGLDAAQIIIPSEGLQVSVEGIPGQLTDHYDPWAKKLRLSQGVAQQPSVAALQSLHTSWATRCRTARAMPRLSCAGRSFPP